MTRHVPLTVGGGDRMLKQRTTDAGHGHEFRMPHRPLEGSRAIAPQVQVKITGVWSLGFSQPRGSGSMVQAIARS